MMSSSWCWNRGRCLLRSTLWSSVHLGLLHDVHDYDTPSHHAPIVTVKPSHVATKLGFPYISCTRYQSQQHKSSIGLGHGDRKGHKCWFFPESQNISATAIIPNYTWARSSQNPWGVTDYVKPVPHKPNGTWPDYLQLSAIQLELQRHTTHSHCDTLKTGGWKGWHSCWQTGKIALKIQENKSKYDFCKISLFALVLKHLRIRWMTWKASGWRHIEIQPLEKSKYSQNHW